MTTTTKTKKKTEQSIDSLPTNPFAFEVLDLASKQRTNAKKVEVLQKYEEHSGSLSHAYAHWKISLTAAPRRARNSVSDSFLGPLR